jgi:hypothetical protein
LNSQGKNITVDRQCMTGRHLALKAQSTRRELSRFSSAIKVPEERFGSVDPSELEQTISARFPVLCAEVVLCGRISHNLTVNPRLAACQAASQPANPPPITIMSLIDLLWHFIILRRLWHKYCLQNSFKLYYSSGA